MKVGFIQFDIAWEDVDANIRTVNGLLEGVAPGELNLLVLPELWPCGFTMNPEAHQCGPTAEKAMMEWAANLNCDVLGGIPEKVEGGQQNRAVIAYRGGRHRNHYAKRKLFGFAGEHEAYLPGEGSLLLKQGALSIAPLICYELRFPELVWDLSEFPGFLVYIANWPAPRIAHWRHLLLARAIENQCYVLGVNRIGRDGVGLDHNGSSLLIDPMGEVRVDAEDAQGLFIGEVHGKHVNAVREKLPFLKDRSRFM